MFGNDTLSLQADLALGAAQTGSVNSKAAIASRSTEAMKASAKQFEAMFLAQMLRPMFDSVKVNETFGGGKGEEMYRSFMVDEYGKQIAESGGIGIADAVLAQMVRIQEQASGGSANPAAQAAAQYQSSQELTASGHSAEVEGTVQ